MDIFNDEIGGPDKGRLSGSYKEGTV